MNKIVFLAFPWEQLGRLLRGISLSGTGGNIVAWILYMLIGCAPLVLWGYLLGKKKNNAWDRMLPLISAALFAGLWFLVNPTYLENRLFPVSVGGMGVAVLAVTLDSLILAWFLLRMLSGTEKLKRRTLLRSLQGLLGIWCVLSAAVLIWQGFQEIAEGFAAAGENRNALTGAFLILGCLVEALPEILELVLFVFIIGFLHSCEAEDFGEAPVKWMERLKKYSRYFLIVILLTNVGFNVLQLLVGKHLSDTHYTAFLPLREIIVVLAVLLMSRFYLAGKQIKDDNNLFI